jgi:hypothetical protein
VFGLAAGSVFRTSTTERFRLASTLLPDNASIFEDGCRDASDSAMAAGKEPESVKAPPALKYRRLYWILTIASF